MLSTVLQENVQERILLRFNYFPKLSQTNLKTPTTYKHEGFFFPLGVSSHPYQSGSCIEANSQSSSPLPLYAGLSCL